MKKFTEAFRESTTLKMVICGLLVLLPKFLLSGTTITYGDMTVEMSDMDVAAFGAAFLALVSPWLHREWRKSKYHNEDKPNVE